MNLLAIVRSQRRQGQLYVHCSQLYIPCSHLYVPCSQLYVSCSQLYVPCSQQYVPFRPLYMPCRPLYVLCCQLYMPCSQLCMSCSQLNMPCSQHLKSLNWLPVKERSTYNIGCLCYHCHSSAAPPYVADMLQKKPSHTRNTRSSTYAMPLLNRPAQSKATRGDRSFSLTSFVWNSIPNDVQCAPSLSSYMFRLKTYLFRSVYKD